ncbi:MAG: hypothetical protein J5700_07580, partial [Treponema sp.]|nr:hypothetical protein [Treponema sp.]
NEGSAYAPFEHLQKAFDTIAATGSDSADYKIYVCGTVKGNSSLKTDLDSKARSIAIEGLNQPESGKSPTDTLAGGTEFTTLAALDVVTKVPVTIKGIKITKSSGSDKSMGILLNNKDANVTLLDGTEISGNKCGVDFNGGGVYIQKGTLCMKSGVIKDNTAKQGGGVYVNSGDGITANLKISGSAKIPCGTDGKNDVYLCEKSDNTYPAIQIAGPLVSGATSDADKIAVTAANWRRKKTVVQAADDCGLADISAYQNYFKPTGKGINFSFGGTDKKIAKLTAPYYVAAGGVDQTTTPGTEDEPYGSIYFACKQLSGGDKETIFVKGSVGRSVVPEELVAANCSGLTIQGAALLPAGNASQDKIDAGGSSIVLQVKTKVPVTIKHLKITGGNNPTVAESIGNGGGIKMDAGTNVTLGEGALVGDVIETTGMVAATSASGGYGNKAASGAGVYNAGGTLTLESGSYISHNYAMSSYNSSPSGGGGGIFVAPGATVTIKEGAHVILNASAGRGGGLYLGGASASSKASVVMTGGNIDYNKTTFWGGGIYGVYASVQMSGGSLSYNGQTQGTHSWGPRGGGCFIERDSNFTMSGTALASHNHAENNGGAFSLADNVLFDMQGGTIEANSASDGNGGAFYCEASG